jgi:hypothetical protein
MQLDREIIEGQVRQYLAFVFVTTSRQAREEPFL